VFFLQILELLAIIGVGIREFYAVMAPPSVRRTTSSIESTTRNGQNRWLWDAGV